MRLLTVKMSSLGDVLHTLPAVTDAARHHPELQVDWVVEEAFAEVPAWHPAVDRVIPIALRRWRHEPARAWRRREWGRFRQALGAHRYNWVIDAQGLIKSALVTHLARGERWGLDRRSAREPLAALAYQHRCRVPHGRHAAYRVRELFAASLGYATPASAPDYGLATRFPRRPARRPAYLVFLQATTWPSKHWPVVYWQALARHAATHGFRVKVPSGTVRERRCAAEIAAGDNGVDVLPPMGLGELAGVLQGATATVGVDTGLGHLAAALGVPCVSLYGATHPGLTGTHGQGQRHLQADFPCAPCLNRRCRHRGPSGVNPACYGTLPPWKVWDTLQSLLSGHAP